VPPPSSPGGHRARLALFDALLRDRRDEHLVRLALRRRLDLRVAHGLLLVCGPDCDPTALGRVIAGRASRAVAVAVPEGTPRHAAVVVPCVTHGMWRHALSVAAPEAAARTGLVIARPPVLGLRALRASYCAAVADAGLAVALDAEGPMVTERELVVPRMLSALPASDQDTLLEPLTPILSLPGPQRSAYVRTLDALHRHGGTQSSAAAVLHVHPNTVRYRIDRIEEMTGLHLDDPRDRLRLDLAAMLVVLRGHPPDRDTDFGLAFREEPDRPWVHDVPGRFEPGAPPCAA
jgi:sugar diacid utilization regulator